jgi:tetrapyrrole methylase family protein/MazG family protein
MQIVEASSLTSLHAHEIAGKIIPTSPLLITQIYNRRLASQVKLALGECYPDEWQVKLVRGAGSSDDNEASIEMPLYELDRNSFANHLSTLYVPPLDEMTALRLPATTRFLTMRLRRDPDGCPWDRAQTHQSLTRYVIEETYEVVEALEENDMEKLAEELGDLLLQVYLHAEIACQQGIFAIGDVHEQLNAKLIRRHPHVFGTVEASNAEQVAQTWEAIKRQERAQAGKDVHKESILNGVPLASPALIVAQEYQKRALKAGFEFSSIERVYAKIDEELKELLTATSPEEQHEEFGDLLFIVVQLACWLKLDAEAALRASNRKFRKRFQAMEELASQRGQTLTSLSLQQWREFWHKAKEITR